VRRLSVTSVEVTWNPPASHGVAGYRVEYAAITTDNDQQRPRFLDTGPYTVAQVSFSVATSLSPSLASVTFIIIIVVVVVQGAAKK